ncbi:hypothetical protein MKEN_01048500 [Mycena kentingensis (nom. inval.)]|nr:hypothetical protein MKEN_01048500 [Mycena kentingensis (nom. inval.)]
MYRTPATALSSKSAHRVSRLREQSPRRSIFSRRDSIAGSDDENDPIDIPIPKPRPSYPWDNEETLVASLTDDQDPIMRDTDAKALARIDSLQTQFNRQGAVVVKDMAHTLQPAVQRVQNVHRKLERHVDPTYINGLLAFDDACKEFEAVVLEDQRVIMREYNATKERIKDLFAHLEDAYQHREKLWTDLEASISSRIDPTIAALAEVPAATERTLASLEKHAKSLAPKEDEISAADKIRGMLAKLG